MDKANNNFLSMTGYGRASREFPWGTVTFELTSVNQRYQDFSVRRLPRELASLESRLVTALRSMINRGKVQLSIEINWTPGARAPALDEDSLVSLVQKVAAIAKAQGLDAPKSFSDMAAFLPLPGVCEARSVTEIIGEDEADIWDEILSAAVASLMEMKRAEGAKLREVIEQALANFESIVIVLAERWKVASDAAIEALRTRIEQVMQRYTLEIDAQRVAQEIAILSDKWDVTEELDRLSAHIERFKETMNLSPEKGKLIGRKLDFLIQEMNREVNTMGSKVSDAEFRWNVVEAKSSLERIREQIQNVE